MTAVKIKPFKVLRIPAKNGEWIDVHTNKSGDIVYINTSGYAACDLKELVNVLGSLSKD